MKYCVAIAAIATVPVCAICEEKKDPIYFGKSVAEWALQLKANDRDKRLEAAANLGLIGSDAKDALPALVDRLEDGDDNVRLIACAALGKIGPIALPVLINALQHRYQDVRCQAARAIASIGPKALSAVPALVDCLQDKDEAVQKMSAYALGQIGPQAKACVPVLIKLLADAKCRAWAASAIGKTAAEGKAAVPTLVAMLKDRQCCVRILAAETLGEIGPEAKEAVPSLIEAKNHGDENCEDGPNFFSAGGFGHIWPKNAVSTAALQALRKIETPVRADPGKK